MKFVNNVINRETDKGLKDMGYIEHLVSSGQYNEVIKFILEILPTGVMNLNYKKRCVEFYPHSDVAGEINSPVDTLNEYKGRVNELKGLVGNKNYLDVYNDTQKRYTVDEFNRVDDLDDLDSEYSVLDEFGFPKEDLDGDDDDGYSIY